VIAFAVLAVAAGLLVVPSLLRGESFSYDGGEAAPFSLSYDGLEEVEPRRGELLRLHGRDGEAELELFVEPLPASVGLADLDRSDALAELALERAHPDLDPTKISVEGRTLVGLDRGPRAHQIAYGDTADGVSVIGKLLFVPPPNGSDRDGVVIGVVERTTNETVAVKLEEARTGLLLNWPIQIYLESEVSVRTSDSLEEPLQSFGWD
jgi:hypothetical protein